MSEAFEDRFWCKVDKSGDCWLWKAGLFSDGYGQFKLAGTPRGAHRVAYELLVGPIAEGKQLDHLCRVRRCVNPAHLEPVTCRENIRRGLTGQARGAQQRAKTHCPQGHPYDETNTYMYPSGRQCRACKTKAVA